MPIIRRYCGSFLICIVSLMVLAVLISLGFWQLERAEEKKGLLIDAKNKSYGNVIDLNSLETRGVSLNSLRYRLGKVKGTFDGERQFLLDNQVKGGVVGYNVLTPLTTATGGVIFVDRGWVAQGLTRELKPDVSLFQSEGVVDIEGEIYLPLGKAYSLGGMDTGEIVWPRVIQYLDFDLMAERLGVSAAPLTLRLSPQAKDGYLREWPVVAGEPEKHWGYAFQWFGMALALFILLVLTSIRRHK